MKNLLNKDNSIRFGAFKCLDTNQSYQVTGSRSTLGDLDHYRDNVSRCVDTVKRLSDGAKKDFKRMELRERFKNVEILKNGKNENA